MANKIQTLLYTVSDDVPATNGIAPGQLWANEADLSLGVGSSSAAPLDMMPIRHHSASANYDAGDVVLYNSNIYECVVTHSAKAFDISDWALTSSAFDSANYNLWSLANTSTNPGTRIVFTFEAPISTYSAVSVEGTITDAQGNWGFALPRTYAFRCSVQFDGSEDCELEQDSNTSSNGFVFQIWKESDTKYHLVLTCASQHEQAKVNWRIVHGSTTEVTQGDPDTIVSTASWTQKVAAPTYVTYMKDDVGIGTATPNSKLDVRGNISIGPVSFRAIDFGTDSINFGISSRSATGGMELASTTFSSASFWTQGAYHSAVGANPRIPVYSGSSAYPTQIIQSGDAGNIDFQTWDTKGLLAIL